MKNPDLNKFLEKIKKLEKGEKLDLSSDEDLSIGIMNLISIEEHLFFTYGKTGKEKYLDLLYEVRELRKSLMKKIIKKYEGESWCIAKHLLSASMRLFEVGTKYLTKGDKKEAGEFFEKSYKLYSLFWGITLGVVKLDDVKSLKENEIVYLSEEKKPQIKAKASVFEKLKELVKRAVDCCRE